MRLSAQGAAEPPAIAALLVEALGGAVILQGLIEMVIEARHLPHQVIPIRVIRAEFFRHARQPEAQALVAARLNQPLADIFQDVPNLGVIASGKQMRNGTIPILMGHEVAGRFALHFARHFWRLVQPVQQEFAKNVMVAEDARAQLVEKQAGFVALGQDVQTVAPIQQKIAGFTVQK